MTDSNHICLTDNSLCVSMVMTLIIFLSAVGYRKGLSLDPCYFYYTVNDLPNASESLTFHLSADDNKQLLDEVEHDIMNYQNRGLPKAEG